MRNFLYFLCLACLFFSCNKTKDQSANTIQEGSYDQSELIQTYSKADSLYQQGIINQELFDSFITTAIKFADTYP